MTWPSSNLYRHLVSSATGAAVQCRLPRGSRAHPEPARPAHVILIGEASHGTQDFYHLRASITKQLIQHHGLTAVAIEADWPDAYRVNRCVRGEGGRRRQRRALGLRAVPVVDVAKHRGAVVRAVAARMERPASEEQGRLLRPRSLQPATSIAGGDRVSGQGRSRSGRRARDRYACFDHSPATRMPTATRCRQASSSRAKTRWSSSWSSCGARAASTPPRRPGRARRILLRRAERAARQNAEAYYRAMFRGRHSSWNIRDSHMAETFDALVAYSGANGRSRRSPCGRTTRISATRAPPRWASAAS